MHIIYWFVSNLKAPLALQRLHKYSSIVLFACLHSPKPLGSSIYSFAMNNVAHLMSDGKIMVSQCRPHISRSAQFTIGHSATSCLTLLPSERVICREACADLTQTYTHTNHSCWPLTAGMLVISPDWTGLFASCRQDAEYSSVLRGDLFTTYTVNDLCSCWSSSSHYYAMKPVFIFNFSNKL